MRRSDGAGVGRSQVWKGRQAALPSAALQVVSGGVLRSGWQRELADDLLRRSASRWRPAGGSAGAVNDDPKSALKIKHNNQTGRWVLPFRAIWTPGADGVVVEACVAKWRSWTRTRAPGGEVFGRRTHDGHCRVWRCIPRSTSSLPAPRVDAFTFIAETENASFAPTHAEPGRFFFVMIVHSSDHRYVCATRPTRLTLSSKKSCLPSPQIQPLGPVQLPVTRLAEGIPLMIRHLCHRTQRFVA